MARTRRNNPFYKQVLFLAGSGSVPSMFFSASGHFIIIVDHDSLNRELKMLSIAQSTTTTTSSSSNAITYSFKELHATTLPEFEIPVHTHARAPTPICTVAHNLLNSNVTAKPHLATTDCIAQSQDQQQHNQQQQQQRKELLKGDKAHVWYHPFLTKSGYDHNKIPRALPSSPSQKQPQKQAITVERARSCGLKARDTYKMIPDSGEAMRAGMMASAAERRRSCSPYMRRKSSVEDATDAGEDDDDDDECEADSTVSENDCENQDGATPVARNAKIKINYSTAVADIAQQRSKQDIQQLLDMQSSSISTSPGTSSTSLVTTPYQSGELQLPQLSPTPSAVHGVFGLGIPSTVPSLINPTLATLPPVDLLNALSISNPALSLPNLSASNTSFRAAHPCCHSAACVSSTVDAAVATNISFSNFSRL
ncbi:hypothetical protein GQ42DRAFT_177840 [Ramicandelaber brevisporus]|nr:hypothetical protein GQ42DRAFT_177840 [Ramicandelaber brevisporus]